MGSRDLKAANTQPHAPPPPPAGPWPQGLAEVSEPAPGGRALHLTEGQLHRLQLRQLLLVPVARQRGLLAHRRAQRGRRACNPVAACIDRPAAGAGSSTGCRHQLGGGKLGGCDCMRGGHAGQGPHPHAASPAAPTAAPLAAGSCCGSVHCTAHQCRRHLRVHASHRAAHTQPSVDLMPSAAPCLHPVPSGRLAPQAR